MEAVTTMTFINGENWCSDADELAQGPRLMSSGVRTVTSPVPHHLFNAHLLARLVLLRGVCPLLKMCQADSEGTRVCMLGGSSQTSRKMEVQGKQGRWTRSSDNTDNAMSIKPCLHLFP